MIFMILGLLIGSCSIPQDSSKDHSQLSLSSEEKFLMELIEQGELDTTFRFSSKMSLFYVSYLDEVLCLDSLDHTDYKYEPDLYKEQAIDAYVNYGKIEEKQDSSGRFLILDTASLNFEYNPIIHTSIIPRSCLVEDYLDLNERWYFKNQIEIAEEEWDLTKFSMFNKSNEENWYSISKPLISEDGKKVLIQISQMCKGLCGHGEIFLYVKDQDQNNWIGHSLTGWYH